MTLLCSVRVVPLTLVVAVAMSTPVNEDAFSLRIIHTNDMHSRFEQISKLGGKCTEYDLKNNRCYGGFPRLMTAVKEQRQKAQEEQVPLLFLNAGDTYQGTAWYSVHKWKVVSALVNMLPIDAMSLGNHEFDDGVEGLLPFLERANFSVITCNLGLEEEPELAKSPLKPSVVLNVKGRSIGIIGYLTPETKLLAQTGKVKIYDEITNITSEAKKMKERGVDIIIAVGHSGFETDLKIAKKVSDVDVVIGGHTNTFLYTGPPPDSEIPANLYPVIVTQTSGRKVAVVQAYAYTKYLGVLNLKFDKTGELTEATGNPQLLDYKVPEDQDMLAALEQWRGPVLNLTKKELGKSKVFLNGSCRYFECNLGNLITDAFIHYGVMNHVGPGWARAPIALQQAGGIRTSIDSTKKNGIVTVEDVIITMPFSNTVGIYSLKGKYLLQALEWSVTRYDPHYNIGRGEFLQYSGIKVTYNLAKPPGFRVVEALARCGNCTVPEMSPIQHELTYTVIMPTFLSEGGDNFTMFPKYAREIIIFDKMDTDIVAEFIEQRQIVYPDLQGRISFTMGKKLQSIKNSSNRFGYSPLIFIVLVVLSWGPDKILIYF